MYLSSEGFPKVELFSLGQVGLRMFLGISGEVVMWNKDRWAFCTVSSFFSSRTLFNPFPSANKVLLSVLEEMTACSLVLPENPLAEYVELPANLTNRLQLGRQNSRPFW